MLKVSGLFVLLCGLLASSSAQEVLSQITNALTQELLSEGFLPSLQTIELQSSLKNVFSPATDLLDISRDSNFRIQLRDPELLQVSLQDSHNNNEAELLVALLFSIQVKNTRISNFVVGNVEKILKNLIINNLGANVSLQNQITSVFESDARSLILQVCPLINSWLYNLNPQVANELISKCWQWEGTGTLWEKTPTPPSPFISRALTSP
ncbi:putative BPIFA4P protein [Camelus dromedarius]|uniref:Putative BPIFA4P protein n=1 Tax=Camelus dromedarius TaxID=9838 RepID=A0A5N4CUL6_CAMDR|nr:putative BPIFA4P protein [Camelus dromedarius]